MRFDACWASQTFKTKVRSRTLDPRWAHDEVPRVEGSCASEDALRHLSLFVSVWDADRASSDDLIGAFVLPLDLTWSAGDVHAFSETVLREMGEGMVSSTLTNIITMTIPLHSGLATFGCRVKVPTDIAT